MQPFEPLPADFLLYLFPPSAFLLFDLIMIMQTITNKDLTGYFSNATLFVFVFSLASLFVSVLYFLLAMEVYYLIGQTCINIASWFNYELEGKPGKIDPFALPHSIFLFLTILPTILFGIYFPVFINSSNLQPCFQNVFIFIAIILLILSFFTYLYHPKDKSNK